jgi:hypothetical protein
MKGKRQGRKKEWRIILVALLTFIYAQIDSTQIIAQTKLKPRILIHDQSMVAGQITVAEVVVTQAAWIVIHRDQAGNLGTAIGLAALRAGVNTNVTVEISPELATATLYAVLHSDGGQPNVYEFPGADAPIVVSNPPMIAFQIIDPQVAQPQITQASQPVQPAFGLYLPLVFHTLSIEGRVTRSANLRAGPGLTFPVVGNARARQTLVLVACDATCGWYQLTNGQWIAAFLVQTVSSSLDLLPRITSP